MKMEGNEDFHTQPQCYLRNLSMKKISQLDPGPQAPVESVPRHSHTHYSARRHQIPKPPKRFVSRVPFWARHSLSEQEKNKSPKQ
jgi:hypothetical protein